MIQIIYFILLCEYEYRKYMPLTMLNATFEALDFKIVQGSMLWTTLEHKELWCIIFCKISATPISKFLDTPLKLEDWSMDI